MFSKYHTTLLAVFLIHGYAASPVRAEQTDEYQEGFLTAYLNRAIEKAMSDVEAKDEPLQYGRHITKYVSAPQFGGYFVGKYSYSNKDDADENGM